MRPARESRQGLALAVTVFLCGAVLLGVEIAASRVLAPTFGSSLYVWGAVIGVVLTGLAIGYWVGGVVADRWPSPYLLVGADALGAVLVLSVPPIAVRLAARSLERLGRTAGRLFSVSTAGSIAGTFATAFWLVPEFGTDQVIAVGAVTLLAAAAVLALAEGLWLPAAGLAAAAGAE